MSAARGPDEIREQIEVTRRELGDTVEALAEKTDVKTRAKHKVEDVRATVTERRQLLLGKARAASPDAAVSAAGQASEKVRRNPMPLALLAALLVGFLIGRLTAR